MVLYNDLKTHLSVNNDRYCNLDSRFNVDRDQNVFLHLTNKLYTKKTKTIVLSKQNLNLSTWKNHLSQGLILSL